MIATYYHETRLFGGLLEFTIALKLINNKTGYFAKPLETINRTVRQVINKKLQQNMQDIKSLTISDYDLIAGATGIGVFLLYMDNHLTESLSLLNTYFSTLCATNGSNYGWFIKYENQLQTNEEMSKYKFGHYDCGAAHGIAGPLFILSQIHERKYNINNYLSINQVLNFYKSIEYKVDDIFTWPGKVSPFKEVPLPYVNISWCYGYTGIFNTLLSAYSALGYNAEIAHLLDNSVRLWRKLNVDSSKMYLRTRTLCHGYAGVLCGMTRTFNLTNDPSLLNNISLLRQYIISTMTKLNNRVSLLEGIQGVLLALLYSINRDTQFESLLLLN